MVIIDANFSSEQRAIIQQCCQIQLESLGRLAIDPIDILQDLHLKGVESTLEEVEEVINQKMEEFQKLMDDPDILFSLDKKNQEMVQFILMEHIDRYDGNPDVNGIWSKFFTIEDLKKYNSTTTQN